MNSREEFSVKLHIYSLQKSIADDFQDFINIQDTFEVAWYPLNEETELDNTPHFALFLLNIQNANSFWLKQQVAKLKELGAHDQNFYFVIYNKESAPKPRDILLVIEDLKKSLADVLLSPAIDAISLKAHKAYAEEDVRFLYFDEYLDEHRTIKQLQLGDADDFLQFQQYIGKRAVEQTVGKWSVSPYLLFWKNEQVATVVTYEVPTYLIEALQEQYHFTHLQAESLEQFNQLKSDKEIISIRKTDEHYPLQQNEFVLSHLNKGQNVLYFDEAIYELLKLPLEKIKQHKELVFKDAKGYSKPKTKIQDWYTELKTASGFTNVVKELGVKMK